MQLRIPPWGLVLALGAYVFLVVPSMSPWLCLGWLAVGVVHCLSKSRMPASNVYRGQPLLSCDEARNRTRHTAPSRRSDSSTFLKNPYFLVALACAALGSGARLFALTARQPLGGPASGGSGSANQELGTEVVDLERGRDAERAPNTLGPFLEFLAASQPLYLQSRWYQPSAETPPTPREPAYDYDYRPDTADWDPKYVEPGAVDLDPNLLAGLRPGVYLIDDPFELLRLRAEQERLGEGATIVEQEDGSFGVVRLPKTGLPTPRRFAPERLERFKGLATVNGVKLLEAMCFETAHTRRGTALPYYLFAFGAEPGYILDLGQLSPALREPLPPWEWEQVARGRFVLLRPAIPDRETNAISATFMLYFSTP
jgi:hypothetical protein